MSEAGAAATMTAPPGAAMPRLETWRNTSQGRVFLTKFNAGGHETSVAVAGGKAITLTPIERRMNQDKCANEELDFFRNGTMEPVRLLDDEWDYQELVANRQILTEQQADELLGSHFKTFEKRLSEIGNPITVQRLIDKADGLDEFSTKKYGLLQARMAELNPDRLAQTMAAVASGTDGLAGGSPEDGTPAPQSASWETFTPDHRTG